MAVESEAERVAAGKPTDREKHKQRREEGRKKKSGCGSCTNCKNMFGPCKKGVAVDSAYRRFSNTTF